MNKYILIGFAGFAVAILMFFAVGTVYAETVIPGAHINEDTVWEKSKSPYRLTGNIEVFGGSTLKIEGGVHIITSTSTLPVPGIYVENAQLLINGSGQNRVTFSNLGYLTIDNGRLEMENTDIVGGRGLTIKGSLATIASSTFSSTSQAINSKNSHVSVWGSHIKGNTNGINIQPFQVFLVSNEGNDDWEGGGLFEIGGIGNALAVEFGVPVASSTFIIRDSSISQNEKMAISNFADYEVDAKENWWGSNAAPPSSGGNRISGKISFTPWLPVEPEIDPGQEDVQCCSSVLFLPGLKATRLYNSNEKLWEPWRSEDVEQLFLNENGVSLDPSVYSGDVLDNAYGLFGIYGKFISFLKVFEDTGKVNKVKIFGYDWRKSIAEVVAGSENKGTSTESLIEAVAQLAADSKTGRVTIIAHSNGGLIAKHLVKTLTDSGKENLIDKVISVAVPYLGTPEAIMALLHGDDQELAGGIFLNSEVARQFGKNMSSAYSLLPSKEYFTKVFSPTIAFASSSLMGVNDGSYPLEITSHEDQISFILDNDSIRPEEVADDDLSLPIIGNLMLMSAANSIHDSLSSFIWPTSIARWGIVGWNAVTSKGLKYGSKQSCLRSIIGMECKNKLSRSPLVTSMGDGTVVTPSASHDAGEVMAVDLNVISETDSNEITHSNILESQTSQSIIKNLIEQNRQGESFELPKGVTRGEPDYSSSDDIIAVSTHSPVELHVYDSEGNHTGLIAPDIPNIEPGLLVQYENKIPGSSFRVYGDMNDPETYIHLPERSGSYKVFLKGTDIGTALFRIEKLRDENIIDSSEYIVPVTPFTIASTTFTIKDSTDEDLQKELSVAPLEVDVNGDGVGDAVIRQGADLDPILNIKLLRVTLASVLNGDRRLKKVDRALAKIEEYIRDGRLPKAIDTAGKLQKRIGHKNTVSITDSDRELILGQIDLLIAQFE